MDNLSPSFSKTRRPFGDPTAGPKDKTYYIEPPAKNRQYLTLPLHAILPDIESQVANFGKLVFHSIGDTGGVNGTATQEAIAQAMEAQTKNATEADKASFFYHLGDVVYYNGLSYHYKEQFFEPYKYYAGPIFAVPGNHDGDTRTRRGDEPDAEASLYGFMMHFCSPTPEQLYPYRKLMTQPYVYWTLQAPLLTIIGLYSNVEGSLDAAGTFEQQQWLHDQLASAPPDQALLIAVHHPPYSLDSSHGGSPDILKALDLAMQTTGRKPHAVLSGHVHNYQRFTRHLDGVQIPYLVAGAGGYANDARSMHQLQKPPAGKDPFAPGFQTSDSQVVLEAFETQASGFLKLEVSKDTLAVQYFTVPFAGTPSQEPVDAFELDLKARVVKGSAGPHQKSARRPKAPARRPGLRK
jgi:calcineurin-like phosphoesterase family protein